MYTMASSENWLITWTTREIRHVFGFYTSTYHKQSFSISEWANRFVAQQKLFGVLDKNEQKREKMQYTEVLMRGKAALFCLF